MDLHDFTEKLSRLDGHDRLDVKALLQVARQSREPSPSFPHSARE